MISLLHRFLNRSALKLWILAVLSLSIVTDGRALYDQNDMGAGKKASHEIGKLAKIQINDRLYSYDYHTKHAANNNFRNPSAAFNIWAAVFTQSPELDPSTLFIFVFVLVGLAAWGRSHPPNTNDCERRPIATILNQPENHQIERDQTKLSVG
jgi:hypothetical protein